MSTSRTRRAVFIAGALLAALTPAGALALTGVEPVDDAVSPVFVPATTPPAASTPAGAATTAPRAAGSELTGTFKIDGGKCTGAGITAGSYFRMINPGGSDYVGNSSSPCGDRTWTPLTPGRDGGFTTTGYQPHPDPPFTAGAAGGATADRIIQPQGFNGVDFSAATEDVDAQTDDAVPVPSVTESGGALSADLRAWNAAWNGQFFNQGSPKPDGSTPGSTTAATGTFTASNGRYVLEWKSLIQGGPFNNFTGVWHLEGTFVAASGAGSGQNSSTSSTTPATSGGNDQGATGGLTATGDGTTSPASAPRSNGRLPRTGGASGALGIGLAGAAGALRMGLRRLDRKAFA